MKRKDDAKAEAKVVTKVVVTTVAVDTIITTITVSRDCITIITMDLDNISNDKTNLIIIKTIMVTIRNRMDVVTITTDTTRCRYLRMCPIGYSHITAAKEIMEKIFYLPGCAEMREGLPRHIQLIKSGKEIYILCGIFLLSKGSSSR